MSLRGIEKAFALGEGHVEGVRLISEYQEGFAGKMKKIEEVFEKCMTMLQSAQQNQNSLQNLIKEKESQNKFWEQTNEDIEIKLDEMGHQKSNLEEQCQEMGRKGQEFEKELKKREAEVLEKENEIFKKNAEINRLKKWIKESQEKVSLMEDQTQMAQQKQRETVEDFRNLAEQNTRQIQNIDRECINLQKTNEILNQKLAQELKDKQVLQGEMEEMKVILQRKEEELKAALGKNGFSEIQSGVDESIQSLEQVSMIQVFPFKRGEKTLSPDEAIGKENGQSPESLKSTLVQNIISNNLNINHIYNSMNCKNHLRKESEIINSPKQNCANVSIKSLKFLPFVSSKKDKKQKVTEDKENVDQQNYKVVCNKNSKKAIPVNAFVAHLNNKEEEIRNPLETFCQNSEKKQDQGQLGINHLKYLEISQFKSPTEFLNTSELSVVKEKNESKKTVSNELNNSYINSKMIELNKKMKETDFKGRPIKENSFVSSDKDSGQMLKVKHFTFTSNPKLVDSLSFLKPPKLASIDNLYKFEKGRDKASPRLRTLGRKPQPMFKLPKLKQLKTTEYINTNMIKHKKALFLMTNQKNLSTSSVSSEEYQDDLVESQLFSEDEGILLSHDVSDLNRKITSQLNPFEDRRKKQDFYRNRLDIKHGSKLNAGQTQRRYSVSTWKMAKPVRGVKFRDLAFVCDQTTKYLKYLQTDQKGLRLISKHSLTLFAEVEFSEIKMVILSEKDDFLMKLILKPNSKCQVKSDIVLEVPTRRKFVNVLHQRGLSHCILSRKSLHIEGDDNFKNYSLNLFPRGRKQGFLNLYVDDFFNDWKTYFVALVDKTLFLFPVFRKSFYENYKACLRKVKIYRMISYNVVKNAHKIGLQERYSFVLKIKNEQTQLIFNAFNKSEKKDWLRFL